MNLYEKVVIFDPNLDDNIVEETVEKIKGVIIKQGGEIFKTENWGRRKLAYELNKHQKGNYILLYFKSPPSTIAELEKFCKVVDSILKFMVVKLEKKKQIEAAMTSLTETAAKESVDNTKSSEKEGVRAGEDITIPEDKKDV